LTTGQSVTAGIRVNADDDLSIQPFATDWYVRFSRDGKTLVHAFQDAKQLTWRTVACDLATGKRVEPPAELAPALDPRFHPDGRVRFSGVNQGKATLLDVSTGKPHATLETPVESRAVRQLAFHPGGKEVIGLIEARKSARLIAWDAATGKQTRTIQELEGVYRNLTLSPDGAVAALNDEVGVVCLIDLATGAERSRLRDAGHHAPVAALAFHPDGNRLISGDRRGAVLVWDFAKRRELSKLQAATYLGAIVAHPGGKTALGCVHDGIALWDLDTRQIVKTIGKGFYFRLALSPDGKRLAAAHRDEELTVWDVAKDEALYHLKGELGRSDGVAFSPDGEVLATAGTDGAIRLWQAATGKPLLVFREEPKDKFFRRQYRYAAFASKDRLVTVDDRGVVEVREPASGRVVARFQPGRDHGHAALHPSGARIALGDGTGPIREFDLATGKATRSLAPFSYLTSLTYHPNGRWLVSGHDSGDICLWPLGDE
jgi:WD40 repeat protein